MLTFHVIRKQQSATRAREEGRDEAAKKILAIIQREQDKTFWRKINYTCGKVRGGSPTSVQVPRNGREDHLMSTPPRQPSTKPSGQTSTTNDSTSQKKPPSAKDSCARTSDIMQQPAWPRISSRGGTYTRRHSTKPQKSCVRNAH